MTAGDIVSFGNGTVHMYLRSDTDDANSTAVALLSFEYESGVLYSMVCAFIHTYIHTCMHTSCVHTYIHTCILTYIHPYVHTYIHTHRT